MKKHIILFFISSILLVLFLLIRNNQPYDDEFFHYNQIKLFMNKQFKLNPYLTVIPGYHFLLALIAKISQLSSLSQLRFINFLLTIFSVHLFYLTAKKISPEDYLIKTVQFAFLPIFFPYRFLFYIEN